VKVTCAAAKARGFAERRRGRKLADERYELGQALPDPGVPGERRLLARLALREELGRPPWPVEQRLEQLPLGAREPGLGVRKLLQQPPHSLAEVRERRRITVEQLAQLTRLGRPVPEYGCQVRKFVSA
jgi:hypothetical protein